MSLPDSGSRKNTFEEIKKLLDRLPHVQKHFKSYPALDFIELVKNNLNSSVTSILKIHIGKTKANITHSSGHVYMKIYNDPSEKDEIVYFDSIKHDLIYTLNSLENSLAHAEILLEKSKESEIPSKESRGGTQEKSKNSPTTLQQLLKFLKIDVQSLEKALDLEDYIQEMIDKHITDNYEDDDDFYLQVQNEGVGYYQLDYNPVEGLTVELLDHYMLKMS